MIGLGNSYRRSGVVLLRQSLSDPGTLLSDDMGDTDLLMPAEMESIVLGAAENSARSLGFTIAAPAKDFLITKSAPALSQASEEGTIETRRGEIERTRRN